MSKVWRRLWWKGRKTMPDNAMYGTLCTRFGMLPSDRWSRLRRNAQRRRPLLPVPRVLLFPWPFQVHASPATGDFSPTPTVIQDKNTTFVSTHANSSVSSSAPGSRVVTVVCSLYRTTRSLFSSQRTVVCRRNFLVSRWIKEDNLT